MEPGCSFLSRGHAGDGGRDRASRCGPDIGSSCSPAWRSRGSRPTPPTSPRPRSCGLLPQASVDGLAAGDGSSSMPKPLHGSEEGGVAAVICQPVEAKYARASAHDDDRRLSIPILAAGLFDRPIRSVPRSVRSRGLVQRWPDGLINLFAASSAERSLHPRHDLHRRLFGRVRLRASAATEQTSSNTRTITRRNAASTRRDRQPCAGGLRLGRLARTTGR